MGTIQSSVNQMIGTAAAATYAINQTMAPQADVNADIAKVESTLQQGAADNSWKEAKAKGQEAEQHASTLDEMRADVDKAEANATANHPRGVDNKFISRSDAEGLAEMTRDNYNEQAPEISKKMNEAAAAQVALNQKAEKQFAKSQQLYRISTQRQSIIDKVRLQRAANEASPLANAVGSYRKETK